MNIKNRSYMASEEFSARQLWLDFVDAAGVCLRVMEAGKKAAWQWFKAWAKKEPKANTKNTTLPLPFFTNHQEWAKNALQICINTEKA